MITFASTVAPRPVRYDSASWTDDRGVSYTTYGDVQQTVTGPICGMCGGHHANAISVKECHAQAWAEEEAFAGVAAAERANERALEDAGYWEARAQEDYEARMGVIPFDVALAAALA